jgi:phospholipid/cholesterol/gamma-HCH transport system ATP-binding protein
LEVQQGETLVLIGESGCGKSVTLKLMMALLEPSSGQILWHGTPVARRSEKQLTRERLRFGYLFQGAALFDSLTVYENVAFGLRQNTRLSESEIQAIVDERLREVGLSAGICSRKPAQLSGGMKKRVGLARALAMSPEVMFYDEPTTGLDPIRADVINELILKLQRELHATSIVVTHDLTSAFRLADRMVMLYDGRVIKKGSPQEFRDSEEPLVRQFIRGESDGEPMSM